MLEKYLSSILGGLPRGGHILFLFNVYLPYLRQKPVILLSFLCKTYILDSFDFYFDHLFGFGNKPGFYDSDVQYEVKMEEDLFANEAFKQARGDVKKTMLSQVPFFKNLKDKMYFLFDFGDDWQFEIELKDFGSLKTDQKYPIVLEINGQAPKQYG